jgi:hypothetical protein
LLLFVAKLEWWCALGDFLEREEWFKLYCLLFLNDRMKERPLSLLQINFVD